MMLSPQLIEQRQESGFQCKASSWQRAPSKHCGHMGFSFNKTQWNVGFHVFKVTHFHQTHNDTHDLTDDNYSMSTFSVLLRADADSSPSPLYKNFRDSVSSHVCLFIIYLSPDIQEVASQASHKSSCLSRRDRVSLLDFQLLLVNQNSILKINWVTRRPLKANYNSTICYSHVLWLLVCQAKYVCVCLGVCVCVWRDQLKDLIGLHCTSGSVENNGAVLLLFFIRLIMIIQVYTSQETWLDLVIVTSAHQIWKGYSFSSFFFCCPEACFQYVAYLFEEYVFVLKCVCMRASVSAREKSLI